MLCKVKELAKPTHGLKDNAAKTTIKQYLSGQAKRRQSCRFMKVVDLKSPIE